MSWNVKGVNKILVIKWPFLMQQQLSWNFWNIIPGKRVSKKYFTIAILQVLTTKEIWVGNGSYVFLENSNCVSYPVLKMKDD